MTGGPRDRGAALLLLSALAGCDSPFFGYVSSTHPDAGPVDAGGPCVSFATSTLPIDDTIPARSDSRVAVRLGDGAMLFSAGSPARYYRVRLDAEPARIAIDTPGFIPRGAYARSEGEIWLGGNGGQLFRGVITSGTLSAVLPAPTSTIGEELTHLDGARGSTGALELYAMTSADHSGSFLRFDGQRWTRLWGPGPMPTPDERGNSGVAWAGPGEAFAVPRGSRCLGAARCVLHFVGGRTFEEPILALEAASTVAVVPGVGPIAGGEDGHLLHPVAGGWEAYPGGVTQEPQEALWVRAIFPFRGGIAFVNDQWTGQRYGDVGYCADPAANALHSFHGALDRVYGALELDGAIVMIGQPTQAVAAVVARPTPLP